MAVAALLLEAKEFFRCESMEGWRWRSGLARFVKASDIAHLSYYAEEDLRFLEYLQVARLLVIDDLGAEQTSRGSEAMFAELIDARARRGLRTAITTNLPWKTEAGKRSFAEHVGGRVMRRINDFGTVTGCVAVRAVEHPEKTG